MFTRLPDRHAATTVNIETYRYTFVVKVLCTGMGLTITNVFNNQKRHHSFSLNLYEEESLRKKRENCCGSLKGLVGYARVYIIEDRRHLLGGIVKYTAFSLGFILYIFLFSPCFY